MIFIQVFACLVCFLSPFSVDFYIDKAECHYLSQVNNGNYRRRGEFHLLIENKKCQVQMLNLNLANRINREWNK